MPRNVKSKRKVRILDPPPKSALFTFSQAVPSETSSSAHSVVNEKDDDGSWESYESEDQDASSVQSFPPWLPSPPPKLEEEDAPTDGSHWDKVKKMLVRFDTSVANDWKDEIQNQLVVVRFFLFRLPFLAQISTLVKFALRRHYNLRRGTSERARPQPFGRRLRHPAVPDPTAAQPKCSSAGDCPDSAEPLANR